jgi:oligopeptide/dipeptide ABC transporter ATP-binding protein
MRDLASQPLLVVEGLRVTFETPHGPVVAVDGASLEVRQGERVGIVGESGSGKSATALSIMGLHQRALIEGDIHFDGEQLVAASPRILRRVRGPEIGLVFQDPLSALDPVTTIGSQITEVLTVRGVRAREARARAIDILQRVGVTRAAERMDDYPHQFSGGMRQRVMIAAAVIAEPRLLIADEPTTALDVRVQAQVLRLIHDLTEERHMGLLLITHDLAVVAGNTDRVYVMYGGRVVESCDTDSLFYETVHPYAWGLLGSVPRTDSMGAGRLQAIRGQPPTSNAAPQGCVFAERCDHVVDACRMTRPDLVQVRPGHAAACIRATQLARPGHLPTWPASVGADGQGP